MCLISISRSSFHAPLDLSSLTIQVSLKQKLVASSRGLKYSFPETKLEVGLEQLSRHEGDLDWLAFIKHMRIVCRSVWGSEVGRFLQRYTSASLDQQPQVNSVLCFIFLHWVGCFFPKHINPLCSIKGFYMCVTPQTRLRFLWKHDWEF